MRRGGDRFSFGFGILSCSGGTALLLRRLRSRAAACLAMLEYRFRWAAGLHEQARGFSWCRWLGPGRRRVARRLPQGHRRCHGRGAPGLDEGPWASGEKIEEKRQQPKEESSTTTRILWSGKARSTGEDFRVGLRTDRLLRDGSRLRLCSLYIKKELAAAVPAPILHLCSGEAPDHRGDHEDIGRGVRQREGPHGGSEEAEECPHAADGPRAASGDEATGIVGGGLGFEKNRRCLPLRLCRTAKMCPPTLTESPSGPAVSRRSPMAQWSKPPTTKLRRAISVRRKLAWASTCSLDCTTCFRLSLRCATKKPSMLLSRAPRS